MPKTLTRIRLPQNVLPVKYNLTLKPDLEAFVFEGEETIFIDVKKPGRQITLHSKDLEIESAEVVKDARVNFALKTEYDEKRETATFTFQNHIPKGEAELRLVFKGVLNNKMRGFYRSSYENNGKTKYLATTQFEATDARRAFPCFDEPAMKAVFEVNIVTPPNHTAISNTLPSQILEHGGGFKVASFLPTPKMSTYLLAFIIGEFEYLESKTAEGVQVRVYTVPGKKNQAKFALDTAVRCLSFYNDYFGIPYPLPTLDLIAVPDFESAAMENWGAVTYRESALLIDEEKSSTANKQWVAVVVAHELAHQWFGNLVTMHWWTDLWLNEGFASYMEHLAVDALFPDWKMWDQFVSGRLGDALHLDALKNTHAIEIEVHHPDEINEIFDTVSYAKGASVIRMLAEYLGEKDFRKGLSFYLKKHEYGNTVTEDLWAALEKISKKPVRKIMTAWTKQAGYPVIKLEEKNKKLTINQERFFSSEVSRSKAQDKTIWPVPVKYWQENSNKVESLLLTKKSQPFNAKNSGIKLNYGQTGFFRSLYPQNYLSELIDLVKNKKIPAVDRVGLISDYMALSRAGEIPVVQFLELARHFKDEKDFIVWEELTDSFGQLDHLLTFRNPHKKFKEFARDIFTQAAYRSGWQPRKNETHTETLLRSLVLYNAGRFGDEEVIRTAKDNFNKIMSGKNIPADLRGVSFGLTAENGGKKEHQLLLKLYRQTTLHEDQSRIGRALALFKQKDLLEKTLEFAMKEKYVRLQDAPSIIATVWSNPHGRDLAWKFVKSNWQEILKRYGEGGHWLGRFVMPASGFQTPEKAKEFEQFFKTHPAPGAARSIQQVLERIKSNILWLKMNTPELEAYFGVEGSK